MIYLKYFLQILKHRWFVAIECWKVGLWFAPFFHDNSKLMPSEFKAYANYYMRKSPEREIFRREYDYAWCGHWKKNPHHWQYWLVEIERDVTTGFAHVKALEIPQRYLKEMLCDWIAAGKAYTGKDNLKEWFMKNESKMILHPNTRRDIRSYIITREDGNSVIGYLCFLAVTGAVLFGGVVYCGLKLCTRGF